MSSGLLLLAVFMGFSASLLCSLYATFLFSSDMPLSKTSLDHYLDFQVYITQGICCFSITIFTIFSHNTTIFVPALCSTMLLTVVSLSDLQTGRIPLSLFLLTLVSLLVIIQPAFLIPRLSGGLVSLILGIIFHKLGQTYARFQKLPQEAAVFGLGDSYALGMFGLLFPLPEGWIAFLFGLLFAVMFHWGLKARADTPFLSIKIRLGFFFLLGGTAMNLWLMFQG
jgi:hypothetical protein